MWMLSKSYSRALIQTYRNPRLLDPPVNMTSTLFLKSDPTAKVDDKKCDIFCLVWLDASSDADDYRNAEQKLRSVINYLKRFQDVKPCQKYIEQSSNDDRIVLIVSGRLGQMVVPCIHHFRQVASIYVYCMDTETHKKWASNFAKVMWRRRTSFDHFLFSQVKAVLDDLDNLVARITEDHNIQKKVDEPLPIDIFTTSASAGQSTMSVNGQFVFAQVLIDCLLRLKSNQADKAELLSCCRSEFKDNRMEQANLDAFEKDYTPEKALRWYTKDTFFYRSVNAALRKQNIHMIFLFRDFIADIQQQMQKHQSNKVLEVYRGQLMTSEELERLKQSIGKLISINSLFSTSTNYSKVLSFLKLTRALERVVFQIKADPRMATTKPFADISKHSDYPDESEVLFMIGSIFRLESIKQNESHVWIIRMSLSSEEEHGLRQVLVYMKGQIATGETNLRTLGKFLWKMGKLDLAERYFIRLLKELQPDDPFNSSLYEDLGELAALRGDYDMSVEYHQKALRLKNGKNVNEANGLATLAHALGKSSQRQSLSL